MGIDPFMVVDTLLDAQLEVWVDQGFNVCRLYLSILLLIDVTFTHIGNHLGNLQVTHIDPMLERYIQNRFLFILPIASMYAIYGNIYHQYTPNVSIYIYTIHGSYGICTYVCLCTLLDKHTVSLVNWLPRWSWLEIVRGLVWDHCQLEHESCSCGVEGTTGPTYQDPSMIPDWLSCQGNGMTSLAEEMITTSWNVVDSCLPWRKP